MKTSTTTKSSSTTKIAVATIFLLAAGATAFIIAPPLKLKSWRTPVLPQLSILNVVKAPDSPSGASSPSSDQVVAKFILSASNNKNIALQEITFNYTAPKFAISTWRLYDAGNGAQLGSATVIDKYHVKFSNIVSVIPAGQSRTFFLRADTGLATAGVFMQVGIDNQPNQIVSDAQIVSGLPVNFGTFLY